MNFVCLEQIDTEFESWKGTITKFTSYKNHYEINIESRSNIIVLFGKSSQGGFVCIPDLAFGCQIVDLRCKFCNAEQLTTILGKVDAMTVATALFTLSDKIDFKETE